MPGSPGNASTTSIVCTSLTEDLVAQVLKSTVCVSGMTVDVVCNCCLSFTANPVWDEVLLQIEDGIEPINY